MKPQKDDILESFLFATFLAIGVTLMNHYIGSSDSTDLIYLILIITVISSGLLTFAITKTVRRFLK